MPDGQLLCVVGPSGREGTVTVDGTPVTCVPDRLAVVFQDYGRSLSPRLTVRDNIAIARALV
ncbi:hypothetical protein ACIBW9_32395 [Streptomyces sp. NPDC049541]|uniref:hypothetical protein n=1 Tax=Streptomyces sp. NPDC049541 TaxID=3365594 RepID=UPI0037BC21B8